MRNGLYYAAALLLLLVTVPMYRYILERATSDAVAPVVQQRPHHWRQPPQAITADDLRPGRSDSGLKTYYACGEPLPEGYRCAASQGLVYRTYEEGGATVIEPLTVAGVHVRCGCGRSR